MTTPKQPATEAEKEAMRERIKAEYRRKGAMEAAMPASLLALREALEEAIDECRAQMDRRDYPLVEREDRVRDWIAVLADTAPAAAEIEARIRAEALTAPETEALPMGERDYPTVLKWWQDFAIRQGQRAERAEDDYLTAWLASPEAEQRLAAALERHGSDWLIPPQLAPIILAALRREQPATEEVGE